MIAALFSVFNLFSESSRADEASTEGDQSPSVVSGGGDVSIQYGYSEEYVRETLDSHVDRNRELESELSKTESERSAAETRAADLERRLLDAESRLGAISPEASLGIRNALRAGELDSAQARLEAAIGGMAPQSEAERWLARPVVNRPDRLEVALFAAGTSGRIDRRLGSRVAAALGEESGEVLTVLLDPAADRFVQQLQAGSGSAAELSGFVDLVVLVRANELSVGRRQDRPSLYAATASLDFSAYSTRDGDPVSSTTLTHVGGGRSQGEASEQALRRIASELVPILEQAW